nr:PIN domain-containing protein [Micromonospora sp. DSM 115978]
MYPAYLCDTLLRLAEAEAYRPLWSTDILTELRRNVIEAGIPDDRVDRRIAHMTRSFPDAMVTGYETLVDGMTNDPRDRYVLAAAVRANAEVVVTFNPATATGASLEVAALPAPSGSRQQRILCGRVLCSSVIRFCGWGTGCHTFKMSMSYSAIDESREASVMLSTVACATSMRSKGSR